MALVKRKMRLGYIKVNGCVYSIPSHKRYELFGRWILVDDFLVSSPIVQLGVYPPATIPCYDVVTRNWITDLKYVSPFP